MAFAEDLSQLFRADDGLTVVATAGAQSANVYLQTPTTDILGGVVLTTDYFIVYEATKLTAMTHASSVTVDGVAYTVRNIEPMDDGKLRRATLSKN